MCGEAQRTFNGSDNQRVDSDIGNQLYKSELPGCNISRVELRPVHAIAIRISFKIGRIKFTCVPTPVTGIKNRGAIIIHNNS